MLHANIGTIIDSITILPVHPVYLSFRYAIKLPLNDLSRIVENHSSSPEVIFTLLKTKNIINPNIKYGIFSALNTFFKIFFISYHPNLSQ